ncbi:hypothetical protein HY214_00630, partial [Candidatus Roizmanbacteria bacterium]|nr:hypothetical protein [Candidatus Roizmanbacteria bacterium]
HAIEQNRTWGIRYLLAVLTNITHEHLDFHRTYERYLKSKVRFLDQAGQAVVNQDDKSYELVKKQVKNKLITYSLREKSADYFGDPGKKLGLSLPRFNAYNYLAAYAVGKIVGIEESIILKALASFTLPPGRLEVVIVKPFTVLVDFAHTPNGFHEVLSAVSSSRLPKKGRLIHIFGAAGRRDASKRPLMGKESATFADLVILTEEDYRDEDPLKICAELALGLKEKGFTPVSPTNFGAGQKEYVTIIDRKEAIAKALSLAKKGDVIILTGKGHEKSLCRGSKEYPWSDTQAVLELLPPKKL